MSTSIITIFSFTISYAAQKEQMQQHDKLENNNTKVDYVTSPWRYYFASIEEIYFQNFT